MRTRLVQVISTLFILTFILTNPALAESNDPNPSSNTPPAAEPEKKKRSIADRAKSTAKKVGPAAVGCFIADVVADDDVCENILDQLADWIRALASYLVIEWWRENCVLPLPSSDPSIGPGQTFINPDCWRQF